MTKTTIDRVLLEQAIDVIDSECGYGGSNSYEPRAVVEALCAALAQPPVEPVVLGYTNAGYAHEMQQGKLPYLHVYHKCEAGAKLAVYLAPPADVPLLTGEDIRNAADKADEGQEPTEFMLALARTIAQKRVATIFSPEALMSAKAADTKNGVLIRGRRTVESMLQSTNPNQQGNHEHH